MDKKYLTVSALTKYIKTKLEMDPHLQTVYVQGEISNFTHHSRGHMYFTLKDKDASIRAVMFRGNNRTLRFTPENGLNVFIHGEISVYEAFGQYQLYVRDMQPDGIGALHLAYEQLKEKLEKAGYFQSEHKQPIPSYPTKIAVITSPTGAAVRDIITTIKRRYPIVEIVVIPTLVQGEEAPASIVRSIKRANNDSFDTIILARGGGSIEDLWGFNDEKVAEAIFHSNIPIISGVGHETDFTISDFVADLRAPTPTAAAELAVPSLTELISTMDHMTERILKLTRITWMNKAEKLQRLQSARAFYQPKQIVYQKEQYIDHITDRMQMIVQSNVVNKTQQFSKAFNQLQNYHPERKMELVNQQVRFFTKQLERIAANKVQQKTNELHHLIDTLTVLNPLHIMKRGFAIPYNENEEIIYSVKDIEVNDQIQLQFADGKVKAKVEEVLENDGKRK